MKSFNNFRSTFETLNISWKVSFEKYRNFSALQYIWIRWGMTSGKYQRISHYLYSRVYSRPSHLFHRTFATSCALSIIPDSHRIYSRCFLWTGGTVRSSENVFVYDIIILLLLSIRPVIRRAVNCFLENTLYGRRAEHFQLGLTPLRLTCWNRYSRDFRRRRWVIYS